MMVQSMQGKMHVVITSLINVAFIQTSLKEKSDSSHILCCFVVCGIGFGFGLGVVKTILGSANAIQSLYKLLLSKAGRRIAKRATIVCVQRLLNSFE
jgi:Na+/H+ antiporter NhaA